MNHFNTILSKKFTTSQEAVEYCQYLAHACGFSVRIRTSKATTIYIVCSKEGKPDIKLSYNKKRNRSSERCYCQWRIVLYYNEHIIHDNKWEFRKGKNMLHNHTIFNDIQLHVPTYDINKFYSSIESCYTSSSPIPSYPSISPNNQNYRLEPLHLDCLPSKVCKKSLPHNLQLILN